MRKMLYEAMRFAVLLCVLCAAGCAGKSSGFSGSSGDLPTVTARQGDAVYVSVTNGGMRTALKDTIANYLESEKLLRRASDRSNADFVVEVRGLSLEHAGTRKTGGMSGREALSGGVMGAGLGALTGGLIGGNKGALIGLASGAALGVGAMAATSNSSSGKADVWELRADVCISRAGEQADAVSLRLQDAAQNLRREDAQIQLEDRLAMQIVQAFRIR